MTFLMLVIALPPIYSQHRKPQAKQRTILRSERRGLYVEKFRCLAQDTSVRHGQYQLIYKDQVIEQGDYRKGQRTGVWEFKNLMEMVEFRYDYDTRTPFNILPHEGEIYTSRTFPCMYLGSPYVPYHFVMLHTFYPMKESGNADDCVVVLALEVSAQGRLTGYHLEQTSRPAFNEAVLKAAAQIPKEWRWVPARRDGRNVASEYKMKLIFEAVE